MKSKFCGIAFVAFVVVAAVSPPAPATAALDPLATVLKQEGFTVSLDLRFDKKRRNSLQHAASLFDWGPNGYATGFVVGDRLVMTAYHVVSGNLSASKKSQLGFAAKDQLAVKAYVNGCQATLVKADAEADLALLRVCRTPKEAGTPAFQTSLSQDEKLLLIARPNGDKSIRRGVFSGPYTFRGHQYWSAKIDGRDGFSGSPVYNDRAEVVGVFSGYDTEKRLAVISTGERARKLLDDYISGLKP
ncbi:MAG: Trypsin-like peptidase domain [Acidobacteriota bacterium]|jgi:S1-C subfamily serine protease|nr:Trypsin-like peptidase domain [Acidobacteriota bacterium]